MRFAFLPLFFSGVVLALSMPSCGGDTDDGGSGGYPKPGPGESCSWPVDPNFMQVTFQPKLIALAPGQTREIDVYVQPDICVPTKLSFRSDDDSVVGAPKAQTLNLLKAKATISLTGGSVGTTKLTAALPTSDGGEVTSSIDVDVMDPGIPACSGSGAGNLDDGGSVSGSAGLAAASVSLQVGATKPNSGSVLWHVDPLDVTIDCAADQIPDGFVPIGSAVTFGPATTILKREIPFTIPINPAAVPDKATLRHVTVSYTGPRVNTPRAIPIANPHFEKTAAGWVLAFYAPWFGTYQAIARADGGTIKKTRHLTHRALVGISMGGGGTAMFGLRNHDQFDVIAPLGGPLDWTFMLGHIYQNHIAGFLPNDGTTPAGVAPMGTAPLPYEHPSTFNQWWYEYPKTGNGGSFPRAEYVQIFRDLALMFGNPNGYNQLPGAENLPAGISPDDKTVVGDHPGRECAVWVDPIDGHPDHAKQEELNDTCPAERCKYTKVLQNYYDDEFNPLGTFPVITVCDGSPQDATLSPYANTWTPENNDKPLELALAVDYNNDGKRDLNEPILRQGYEPYQDLGTDGVGSAAEPGYQASVNEDPNGDDWQPQYNPTGTEGNARWDEGEPYADAGLDGVAGTTTSPYDFGEGNGKFDYAPGYRTFLERDSRSVLERLPLASQDKPPFDDEAMSRLDMWTDGGTRDLFNFAVGASALAGAWSGRNRVVHYYTESQNIPGQNRDDVQDFAAGHTDWGAVPSGVMLRYGKIDPAQKDIDNGSGQHVGTADEITRRLQSALYYIGSRWPDAPLAYDEPSNTDPSPDADDCEIFGGCDFTFTDSRGRAGPVAVNVPPGYAHIGNKDKRYPVIFLLHGYGQTPEDLKAAIVFLGNWMNFGGDSSATRLPKAIMVYVDGRCRAGVGEAECIRGTFYTDSVREKGPKMEGWFLELMTEIDKRYRTMPPADIEWTQ